MKKWLILLLIILIAGLAGVYIFIPGKLIIGEVAYVNCSQKGAYRILTSEKTFPDWWPGKLIKKRLINSLETEMHYENAVFAGTLYILPLPQDSAMINWQSSLPTSMNPVQRIIQYRQAILIKDSMHIILDSLRHYLDKKENVYGMSISESSINNTVLIATRSVMASYPSTNDIYALVGKLKDYAKGHDAKETGAPMVHIESLPSHQYEAMVAIPINKELPESGSIFPRKMILGKYMVSEVKGGNNRVKEAFQQMQLYFDDYRRTSMAIPFEILVTDRSKEPDTTKWITKIYAPVY